MTSLRHVSQFDEQGRQTPPEASVVVKPSLHCDTHEFPLRTAPVAHSVQ